MAKTEISDSICVVDDEIHYVEWLIDYLEHKGYKVRCAETIDKGIEIITEAITRCLIIDLNVPMSELLKKKLARKDRYM